MSGCDSSSLHSATRRFSPPDRFLTSASHAGSRNASAAMSSVRSRSQPFAASIFACRSPCRSSSVFISSSDIGSANLLEIASYSVSSDFSSATPSSTLPRTSLLGVELRFLRQEADFDAFLRARFAVDRCVDAGHDPQQRRLTGAVQTEHADLGAREKRQRNVLQDLAPARDDLGDTVHGVDVLRHLSAWALLENLRAAIVERMSWECDSRWQ